MAYENAEMYRIEMNNKIGAVGVNGKFYLYLKKIVFLNGMLKIFSIFVKIIEH